MSMSILSEQSLFKSQTLRRLGRQCAQGGYSINNRGHAFHCVLFTQRTCPFGGLKFEVLLQANEPAGAGGFLLKALLANVFWDHAVAHELAESPATEADTKDGF